MLLDIGTTRARGRTISPSRLLSISPAMSSSGTKNPPCFRCPPPDQSRRRRSTASDRLRSECRPQVVAKPAEAMILLCRLTEDLRRLAPAGYRRHGVGAVVGKLAAESVLRRHRPAADLAASALTVPSASIRPSAVDLGLGRGEFAAMGIRRPRRLRPADQEGSLEGEQVAAALDGMPVTSGCGRIEQVAEFVVRLIEDAFCEMPAMAFARRNAVLPPPGPGGGGCRG